MTAEVAPVLSVDEVSISFSGSSGDGSGGSGSGNRDGEAAESRRTVVEKVSFDLHPGRVLALVGESGSGKSVTAMATLGLLPANAQVSGSIRLASRSNAAQTVQIQELIGAESATLRSVRGGQIGTIFQEPMSAFDPVYSIGRQIAEAIRAHPTTLRGRAVPARVNELLASVGIRDPHRVARSYPHELSGGQLQRAMIAMAISCDPIALIADEPTTALDVTVQAGILELIRELRDRLGTAVLLITHDMGVVADLADDVVVLRDGVVVERADAATLFAHPSADYTKQLLAAVPRLAELSIADRQSEPPVAEAAEAVSEEASATEASAAAARLEHASVSYPGRGFGAPSFLAVDDVSFELRAGEIFGLVGESGSGKSTVGRALVGLIPLTSGSARVAGIELARASRGTKRELRSRIGYIFQDPASSLNPRFTIGQSIAEPLQLHARMSVGDQRTRVAELLDAVQLGAASADRFQHELSGGQRQRVAIARAIALRPALLIADEPTSALDVSVQATVLELLRELQADYGFACLFISHDLAVVHELVDQVAVMHAGRIVEAGAASRVLASPADPYTQRLLAAAPVADPDAQRTRREAWRELVA